MNQLAELLRLYLEVEIRQRLKDQQAGRTQVVFVGPPLSVLEEVFDLVTGSGQHDWKLEGIDEPVVVLLIGSAASSPEPRACTSARANWDYAVTARHSGPACVVLVGPREWDRQPESIENASDRLGQPGARTVREFVRAEPWPFICAVIERITKYPATQVRRTLRDLWRDSRQLDQLQREELPWMAADDLLGEGGLAESVGLPCLAPGIPLADGIRKGRRALEALAKSCAADGFADAEQRLQEARVDIRELQERDRGSSDFLPDAATIPEMMAYLRSAAGSGGAFALSPSLFFRLPDEAKGSWWEQITNEVLEDLVRSTDAPKPRGKTLIRVTAMLQPARDEPFVVSDEVALDVVQKGRDGVTPIESASFFRRCRESNAEWLDVDGGELIDDDVPEHSKPISYKAVVPNFADTTVRVISLDKFACHGHVHVNGALRNPAPARRSRGMSPYEQVVVLRQAGIHRVIVFVSSDVAVVALKEPDSETITAKVVGNRAEMTVYVEQSTQKTVALFDSQDALLSSWELSFQVEETTSGVVSSQFDDLVLSHQEGERSRVVSAPASQARELELQVMEAEHGYRGLLGCWLPRGAPVGQADWETCRVGDVHVPASMDPRPPSARQAPPATYLESRKKIVSYLSGHPEQYISEILLAGEEPQRLAQDYVAAYHQWLLDDPAAAAWSECVALYTKASGGQAAIETVSDEPVVLLLTPLHPIRFAWHVNAQSFLKQGLDTRCPLAGLISPHHTPSITALPIWFGQQVDWRPFISVGCEDKHWAVLVNGSYLRDPLLEGAFAVLGRLGLTPQGVTGGMSVGQAKRALNDVTDILCAKPILRVGLVGNPQEEAGSAEGLIEWVQDGFRSPESQVAEGVDAEDADEVLPVGAIYPSAIEVFDFRQDSAQPSEISLANLAEDVDGRLRWFNGGKSGQPVLDVVLFDQVGTTAAKLRKPEWTAESRSVLGRGAMFRVHIREDQSAGRVIGEARVGRQRHAKAELEGAVMAAVQTFEELAIRGNATHLEFSPDRQTLVSWVDNARFVAATSSQVDPACFIRGSGDHGEYLWDYDLPTSAGVDAGAAGYYLIARPRSSMKEAVTRSLAAVLDPPPSPDAFLREISKRGIPVLKRLASGGRRSKGEVGMLLAVRLLQDAFREVTTAIRLPVVTGCCVHMLLAVDSYQAPLASVRKSLGNAEPMRRPDLLVFAVSIQMGEVKIKVTPLEVKFHTTQQNRELTEAVEQANSLGRLLKTLWVDAPVSGLWDACGRALLARCLDECFRIYADPALHQLPDKVWAQVHEEVLQAVLGQPDLGDIVSINTGRLVAFGPAFSTTRLVSMDGDALQESLLVDREDCRSLLEGETKLSAAAEQGFRSLLFSLEDCGNKSMEDGLESLHRKIVAEIVSPTTPHAPAESEMVEPAATTYEESLEEPGPVDDSPVYDEDNDAYAETSDPVGSPNPAEATADTGQPSLVPPEIRERVAAAFAGFVGNEKPVRRVTRDLLVGLMSDPPNLPRNYLLVGLPSVGKTEMARRIAGALGLPFVKLDGPGLTTREKLFSLIDGQLGGRQPPTQVGEDAGQPVFRYPPFVVLIDEVHVVPQKVQESLLTMLEAADRTVRLTDRVAEVPEATFIFATTQDSKIDKAFKSRCTEIHLRSYTVAEVAEMINDYVRRSGIDPASWDPEVYPKIALLGRLIPRRTFEVAKELMDELQTTENPDLSVSQHLEIVRDMMEVDENGLGPLDIEYLDVLDRADRPLGEDMIATMIGTVDKDKIVEEVEPLLRRLNLIVPGARGREITPDGREYIATWRASR